MGIFFTWIILSFVVGFVGSDRKIGFGGAFFISLILSPLIGLIFALMSKTEEEEKYKQKILDTQKSQEESLKMLSKSKTIQKISIADEIEKLQKLKNNNSITEEEFVRLKNKIIDFNMDYEDYNTDISTIEETKSVVNESTKNKPNYVNPNAKQEKPNLFIGVLIVLGIIFIIVLIKNCSNKSSDTNSHFTDTISEVAVDTSVDISDTPNETIGVEKNILKNFTYEDVARFTMATVMGQPSNIIKVFKKDDLYYVSYVRKSDSQKFDYKVKIVENQIVWAGAEKGQRWRDSAYDEKISFTEKGDKLNIITTYGDGSEGVEEFKKGD
jgi:hypothetical protein